MERAPLPSPLPARASQGEGAGVFSDGGCIKLRTCTRSRWSNSCWCSSSSVSWRRSSCQSLPDAPSRRNSARRKRRSAPSAPRWAYSRRTTGIIPRAKTAFRTSARNLVTRRTGTARIWKRTSPWTRGTIPTFMFARANTIPAATTCTRSDPTDARGMKMTLPIGNRRDDRASGFTLIELILVMAMLAIVISVALPSLKGFFRGRNLDSEARRFLSLTRYGQSRAVSEGVPMVLWIDTRRGAYGLQQQSGYTDTDSNAVKFALSEELRVEVQTPVVGMQTSPLSQAVAGVGYVPM